MTTEKQDRMAMPGQGPTDEDLRLDAELTRQELAKTVAALSDKVDVKARAHEKADEMRARTDELVGRLPDPVAARVRPVVAAATRRPGVTLAGLLVLLLVLTRLLKR